MRPPKSQGPIPKQTGEISGPCEDRVSTPKNVPEKSYCEAESVTWPQASTTEAYLRLERKQGEAGEYGERDEPAGDVSVDTQYTHEND
jgi:hypothetical protein